jgi:hypothetical protein
MAAQDFRLPPPPAISAQAAALRAAFPGYTINVGVISGDWLLTGHIQVDTCTEAGCLDWHTVTLYRNGKEVLTIALSPSHDIELAQQLATRAESVLEEPQQTRSRKPRTPRRPLSVSPTRTYPMTEAGSVHADRRSLSSRTSPAGVSPWPPSGSDNGRDPSAEA